MNKYLYVTALAVAMMAAGTANAASYTWTQLAGGTFNWDDANNWGGVAYPNAAGDVANLNVDLTGALTVNAPAAGVTLGILNYGDTTATMVATKLLGTAAGSADKLIFDNGGAGAQINHTGGPTSGNEYVYGNIQLNDNLTISNTGGGAMVRFYTVFSGGRSVTTTGNRVVYFNPGATPNNFSAFVINSTKVALSGTSGIDTVNCDITIKAGAGGDAIQQYVPEVINDHAVVDFTVGRFWNAAGLSETIGALKGVAGSRYAGNNSAGASMYLALAGPTTDPALARDFAGVVGDGGYSSAPGGLVTLVMKGNYTQTLSGSSSNDLAHARVEKGILALNKAAGKTAIGITQYEIGEVLTPYAGANDLTLGDGVNLGLGEVKLLAADQILDNTAILFKGGILNANGFGETCGVATLQANSDLQMLSGAFSVVSFADSSGAAWTGGTNLTIKGWDGSLTGGGAEQVLFGSSASGLTAGELAQVSFLDPAGLAPGTYGAQILGSGEVVPVPEPATLGLLVIGGLLASRRRK